MGAEFIIRELGIPGGKPPSNSSINDGYELFRWTAANRNIPKQPWSFGVTQRTARTDYPGADAPTEQVLGPNFEPFTLAGTWDDRYNMSPTRRRRVVIDQRFGEGISGAQLYEEVGGYAVAEWRRFEAMVRRGNPVRVLFENVLIEGIITNADFDYMHKSRIGYSFTLSPHHRQPGGFFRSRRSPRTALNARQLSQELATEVEEVEALNELAPQTALIGTIYADATEYVDALVEAVASIDTAIDQRNLTPEQEPNAALRRLSAQFYSATTVAFNLIELLRGYDTSESLNYEAAASVLVYEYWARGLMFYARRVVVVGRRAASDILQRAAPNALSLYTPKSGESLYAISNRFYRTPHQWRRIAERNGLVSLTLSGAELLVIPEVTIR